MTPVSHEEFSRKKHFAGLDGLRCLAILPVVFHHATPRPLAGIAGKGAVGVDLFFVLSGFLITTLLLRERASSGTVDAKRFFVRRALRIFPLYYAVLGAYVVYALLQPSDLPERNHLLRHLIHHATYTANWFVDYDVPHPVPFSFSWSLCVEEQFYLFWPLLVAFVPSRAGLAACLLALFGFDAFVSGGGASSWVASGSTLERILTSFSLPIGCGAALALALDAPRAFPIARFVFGRAFVAPLALLGAVVCLMQPATPYFTLCFFLTALVGGVVLGSTSTFTRSLDRPFVRRVGALSYALYLSHITIIAAVRRLFPTHATDTAFVFFVSFPAALLLAALLQQCIEKPVLAWRDRRASTRATSNPSTPARLHP